MAKVNGKVDSDRSKKRKSPWDGSSSVKADDDDISMTEDAKRNKAPKPNASRSSHAKEIAPAEGEGYKIEGTPAKEAQPGRGGPAKSAQEFDSSFGWVELRGKRYDFDVIVHVDGSVTKREKGLSRKKKEKYGHTPLTSKELKVLEREAPDTFIIGTGQSGSMPLTPKAERFLDAYIYYIGKTPEALQRLAISEGKTIALLHVTC